MQRPDSPNDLTPELEELLEVVATFEEDANVLDMLRHFLTGIMHMKIDKQQTVSMVCNKQANWQALDAQKQQDVGKHVSRLVSMGLLPVKKGGKNSGNSWLYVLK